MRFFTILDIVLLPLFILGTIFLISHTIRIRQWKEIKIRDKIADIIIVLINLFLFIIILPMFFRCYKEL